MPCEPFKGGFICSRNSGVQRKCVECKRPAGLLCDYPATKASKSCSNAVCGMCALRTQSDTDYCPQHRPFVFQVGAHDLIVVNTRRIAHEEHKSLLVMVDRTTALGNDLTLTAEPDRDKNLLQYRQWLWAQLSPAQAALSDTQRERREAVRSQLAQILTTLQSQTVLLGCWCALQSCHAQIIAKALVWAHKQGGIVVKD